MLLYKSPMARQFKKKPQAYTFELPYNELARKYSSYLVRNMRWQGKTNKKNTDRHKMHPYVFYK